MKQSVFVLLLLTILCVNDVLGVKYKADITITNDPIVKNAAVQATMFYYYNENDSKGKHTLFMQYNNIKGLSMKEFIDYSDEKRYIYCSACETQTYKTAADQLYPLSGDSATSEKEDGCTKYTRKSGTVAEIWATGNTKDSKICKIVFRDGKVYKYNTYVTSGLGTTNFVVDSTWKCPQPVCSKKLDVVLVLDDSGSIGGSYGSSGSDWRFMIDFSFGVIDGFDPSTTYFGIATFGNYGKIVSYFDTNRDSLKNQLKNYNRGKGMTCMGCGIQEAIKIFSSAREDATQIMIVLSDGYNNYPDYPWGRHASLLNEQLNIAKSRGITIVALGISSGVDANLMKYTIATSPNLYFHSKTFKELEKKLGELVSETCSAVKDTYTGCSATCNGFCGCGQSCYCPPCDLSKTNKCVLNECKVSSGNNLGCVVSGIKCTEANRCYGDKCDPTEGCLYPLTDCSGLENKACVTSQCLNSTGCKAIYNDNMCGYKKCKVAKCIGEGSSDSSGCNYTDRGCPKKNCMNSTCNNETDKCEYTSYECPEPSNKCKVGVCNPKTDTCDHIDVVCPKQNCMVESCDPNIGCVYKKYTGCSNLTDPEPCTYYFCDDPTNSCSTAPITDCEVCDNFICPESGDPCNISTCINENGKPACSYTHWNDTECAKGCIPMYCNSNTGACEPIPNATTTCKDENRCRIGKCNSSNSQCYLEDLNCTSSDLCFVGTCDNETGCKYTPVCEDKPCHTTICTIKDGKPNCSWEIFPDCVTDDECKISTCNAKDNRCEIIDICFDRCSETNLDFNPCNNDDPCLNNSCINLGRGKWECNISYKCDVETVGCTKKRCTLNGECVSDPIDCSHINVSGAEQSCYKVECDDTIGCYKAMIETAFVDLCGTCLQTFGADESTVSSLLNDVTCIGKLEVQEFAGALAGSVIAVIVVACVVVAIVIGTLGYFGTKELIRRANLAQDQSANNNPLYEGNNNEMTNPSYTGEE